MQNFLGVIGLWGRERSWALHDFPLVLLYCPRKVRNGNCERGCKGKLIPGEVKSNWLKVEGGFPRIIAREYIMIPIVTFNIIMKGMRRFGIFVLGST